MAKPFQYAVTALRVLVLAVCVPLLIASLVLWPRSRFYVDQIEIAVDGKAPRANWGTHSPGAVWYTANAIHIISGFGSLMWMGPGEITISSSEIADPWNYWSDKGPTSAAWVPEVGRYKNGYPDKNGTLNVTAPYWLLTTIALLGIAIALPITTFALFSWRVGISSLLVATLGVAILITLYKVLGDGGVVLGVEAISLCWIARKACIAGAHANGWNRRGALVVAILCLAGFAAVAAFTAYAVSVPVWTLPRGFPQ